VNSVGEHHPVQPRLLQPITRGRPNEESQEGRKVNARRRDATNHRGGRSGLSGRLIIPPSQQAPTGPDPSATRNHTLSSLEHPPAPAPPSPIAAYRQAPTTTVHQRERKHGQG